MNLVSVSAIDFDPNGSRVLRQDAGVALSNRNRSRRVSRTATLDGGAEVYDTGYAAADRTLRISTTLDNLEWFERMVSLYNLVRVSTDEGAFIGVPSACGARDGKAEMTILITEGM